MKPGYSEKDLEQKIYRLLKIKTCKSWKILKQSLDSRKHDNIHYEISVGIFIENEDKIVRNINNNNIMLTNETIYSFPHIINTDLREYIDINPYFRPVIIGSGPAGYHAAIELCHAGFKPIVIERGKCVEDRVKDIDSFWNENRLNTESNVCFGEGGAGTFSDGKLNTGNKDKGGYFKEVLEIFAKYGADPSILYNAKPHIGTDVLRNILKNMRNEIIRLGGDVRFCNKLNSIDICNDNKDNSSSLPLYRLSIENTDTHESYDLYTFSVILAIGHSATDTYKMLLDKGFDMEQKPFALGIRVEHNAESINKAMYGENFRDLYGDSLPTADYKLVYHTASGRSVFSFCMCPGGYVVDSSSDLEAVCINGMSYSGRDGENSNSAIIVNITPEDYNSDYVLAGVDFQKEIERKAYIEGNGTIPVQIYKDLKADRKTEKLEDIKPAIKGSWNFGNLRNVLPDFVIDALLEAMPVFGRKIKGYDRDSTVLSAVESRSSAPVRILRNNDMNSISYSGIIPCGEGAGYAGGITSSAADGIKAAEAVSEYLIEPLIRAYKEYEESRYTKKEG